MTTYIVIPVFFDTRSASGLLRGIADAWSAHSTGSEDALHITVVDNAAGRDATIGDLEGVLADHAWVEVIRTPYQSGHQHALLSGLESLRERITDRDVIVTMDGDGEDGPQDAFRLAQMCREGADLVLAERTKRHQGAGFRAGYMTYRAVYRVLTGLTMRTGNFAAMNRRTLLEVLANPLFRVSYSGSLPTIPGARTLPCEREPRIAGRSKMNTTALVAHGLLSLIPQAQRIAVRLFLLFAAALALAVGGTLAAIILRATSDIAAPGWATTIILGAAMVAGIAFLGFLCGLILLATLQVLRKPQSERFG